MESEKKATNGAANTEGGKENNSNPSLSDLSEKVKHAKVNGILPEAPGPKSAPPLDLRTEMFMLNELRRVLEKQYGLDSNAKYSMLSALIARCAEANGL